MNKTDWKVRMTIVLAVLIAIFVTAQFIVSTEYKKELNVQMDDLGTVVVNYIDANIESICDALNAFQFLKEIDNASEDNVKLYLGQWVENTDGVSALYYIDENDHMYLYSISDEFKDIEILGDFDEITKTSSNNTYYFNNDKKVLYIGRKLYDNYGANGCLIVVYDYCNCLLTINKSGLDLNCYNVDIYDNYNNIIYSNYSSLENNDEEKDKYNIVGLNDTKSMNLIKKIIIDVKDFIDRTFILQDKNYVSNIKTSMYDILKVKLSCDVNDASFYLQTRFIVTISVLCIILFMIIINSVFVTTNFSKAKIYILTVIVFEIILTGYFIAEIIFMDKTQDKFVSESLYFISETINIKNNTVQSKGDLTTDMLRNTVKLYNVENENFKNKLNEIAYVTLSNFEYSKRFTIINNDKVVYSYPDYNNNVKENFDKFIESGNDIFYEENEKMIFYTLNNGTDTLCFEYDLFKYDDEFSNCDFINTYNDMTKEEMENLDKLYERLSKKSNIKQVTKEISYLRIYESNKILNYIFAYNTNEDIYDVFILSNENRFIKLSIIYSSVFLFILFFTIILNSLRKKIETKEDLYDKKSKNDMIMLDRLLKKINDDIYSISKSSEEIEVQSEIDNIDEDIF